jgi:hypothetical protein
MHLAETSLIKKYENDIGSSIVEVGGEVSHELHWLPYLDDQILEQLVGGSIIDEKIDERLDARGVTEENIAAWNQAVSDLSALTERVGVIEGKPAMEITAEDIEGWNKSSKWQEN